MLLKPDRKPSGENVQGCGTKITFERVAEKSSLVHGVSMLIVDKRIDAGATTDDIPAFANQMTSQLPVSG